MKLPDVRETRNFFFFPVVFLLFSAVLSPVSRLAAQEKTVTYYSDPASVPTALAVKITHLTARVAFRPEKNLVEGTAEFTFRPFSRPADSIVFHTPDFQVTSVKIDGKEVKYLQSGPQLIVYPPAAVAREGRILIAYTATPLAGPIYFVGWKPEEAGKRKEIWAHRPMGWLPYMEGRITVDMYVTFDKHYTVFSNGERTGVQDNADGTRTWHYAMKKDHPFFSTALVIGDYKYQTDRTSGGTPLEYWYYSDMGDRVATTYKYTPQMFDFYEKELGVKYPYPVYREAPVIDYMYGGMETTTSTIFGDFMLIDPRAWWQRNYVNVNAHELAHQWFGNCVAHFVNRDVWLTESFATYYAKLFERSVYGEDYYQNVRNEEMKLAFESAKKNSYPVGGTQGGTQRIYQKGSLVLDMLRNVMGDRGFRDAVRMYLGKYGFGYAETGDFIRCCYEATGKPYNWFFDEWILRGGEPVYTVRDMPAVDQGGNRFTRFRVWQDQEINDLNGLFRMPVMFEVHYSDGTCDSMEAWVEKKFTEVNIPNPGNKEVAYTLFDPGRKILKQVTYERSYERLAAQALTAAAMIDRHDALVALRTVPVEKKRDLLVTVFRKETFWLPRAGILEQLAQDHSPEVVEIFREALLDRDALVRKAALKNLEVIPDLLQSTVEGMLNDSSYVNVELALDALCRSFPAGTGLYLETSKGCEGWRGKNIRMKWLEIAIAYGKKEFLPELIGYTGPGYEFETRMNAFIILKKLGYSDAETRANAEAAARHWNNKLSAAAKEYLKP